MNNHHRPPPIPPPHPCIHVALRVSLTWCFCWFSGCCSFVVEASTRIRWSGAHEGRAGQAQISTDSNTVVGVEPPGPFALLPVATLEQAGAFVISATVRVMQDVFVRSLADDYRRWATDAVYRAGRAAVAPPIEG
jgi:hypothetical protein